MLFRSNRIEATGYSKKKLILTICLGIFIIFVFASCYKIDGTIIILEDNKGTGVTMVYNKWSSYNKCELSLQKGDVLKVEIINDVGVIDLKIIGKKGSKPYTGTDLDSCVFTVTVSERDKYDILIKGKDATGKVTVNIIQSDY